MTVIACVALLVALLALGGWAYTLIGMTRAALPNAQAYQALSKVNNEMDERIRNIVGAFQKKQPNAVSPTPKVPDDEAEALSEILKRAQKMGFKVGSDGSVEPQPTMPQPDPVGLFEA